MAGFFARANAARPQHEEELAEVMADIAGPRMPSTATSSPSRTRPWPRNRCAPRIEALSERLQALQARQLELSRAVEEHQDIESSVEELAAIRARIREAVISGPDSMRKALLHDMVAEIRVQSRRAIIPVFRLPLPRQPQTDVAVRHLFRVVDPVEQHANHFARIEAFPIRLANCGP